MKGKRVSCPICHKEVKWERNPYRPFCSERCKLIDLGEWAAERYRVAGEKSLYEAEQSALGGEKQENGSSEDGEKPGG